MADHDDWQAFRVGEDGKIGTWEGDKPLAVGGTAEFRGTTYRVRQAYPEVEPGVRRYVLELVPLDTEMSHEEFLHQQLRERHQRVGPNAEPKVYIDLRYIGGVGLLFECASEAFYVVDWPPGAEPVGISGALQPLPLDDLHDPQSGLSRLVRWEGLTFATLPEVVERTWFCGGSHGQTYNLHLDPTRLTMCSYRLVPVVANGASAWLVWEHGLGR